MNDHIDRLATIGVANPVAGIADQGAWSACQAAFTRDRNLATVHTYFRLQQEQDLDTWITLWADDGAQAIPYAPDGFPKRVTGRTRLDEIYRNLFAGYAKLAIVDPRIDPLHDPNRVLARWHTHAELSDGTTYDNDLVGLFEFDHDGRLRLLTEYFDPTPFAGITAAGETS